MCQPSDRIGFAAACGMLYQIVFLGMMLLNISDHLAHGVQLMVPREDQRFFFLFLAGVGILFDFLLQENDLVDQIQHGILFQDILPHI